MARDEKKADARLMTIPVTRHPSLITRLLAASAILFFAMPNGRAQPSGVQRASDFTSVEYFEPPNQQQMKSRLSGAEAQPLAGGLLAIRQLKLETFDAGGKPEMIVNAPECVYDTLNHTASSPGHLTAQTGDGKYRVEGDGFLWRQNDSKLTISNNVLTTIEKTMK
ncbi:MAG TPA: hypothetical protein VN836_08595 [Verrucomicrobiae bacterium]|nr:hypothetical protein [Verrucomicrobiae bacterium]